MTSRLEQRIKAALKVIAEQPVINPVPVPTPHRTLRPMWIQLAAAVSVLLIMLVFLVNPFAASVPPAGTQKNAVVPKSFAAFSLLTAKLSNAPLGQPGIAIVSQGKSGITGLFTQVVVVGADGRTYRRVDVAEDRGARAKGGGDSGEWYNAQAVLSRDGQRLAIGSVGRATEIPVLDLVTGERRDYRLPKAMSYYIADWSHDGRKLALTLPDEPDDVPDPYAGAPDRTKLAVLDLDSGTISLVPGMAARYFMSTQFGPSGRLFTIMQTTSTVRIIDFSLVPEGEAREIAELTGDVMWWSPDETRVARWLANDDGTTIRLTDLAGHDVREPVSLAGREYCDPIGWRGPDKLLLFDSGTGELVELTFQTGRIEVLSRFDTWVFGDATKVRFAEGLIENAHFEDTSPQRGPWPWWMWAVIALAALAVYLIVRRIRRRQ